jgi:hypothetical protein
VLTQSNTLERQHQEKDMAYFFTSHSGWMGKQNFQESNKQWPQKIAHPLPKGKAVMRNIFHQMKIVRTFRCQRSADSLYL